MNESLRYTEEIFNVLSKGGFISANSVSSVIKRYYDVLEEEFQAYYNYYKGIGFYLEAGDGYFLFTRREAKVDLERKLESVMRWIDYLSFLKTYNPVFGAGFTFRPADIEVAISCNMELKDKAEKLFREKKVYAEIVDKLVNELEKADVIELENEHDKTYKVLTAFRYMEELVDCIRRRLWSPTTPTTITMCWILPPEATASPRRSTNTRQRLHPSEVRNEKTGTVKPRWRHGAAEDVRSLWSRCGISCGNCLWHALLCGEFFPGGAAAGCKIRPRPWHEGPRHREHHAEKRRGSPAACLSGAAGRCQRGCPDPCGSRCLHSGGKICSPLSAPHLHPAVHRQLRMRPGLA